MILSHFDMNGDGQISFEEFVNGMRRMGGSARDGGGLLSVGGQDRAQDTLPKTNGTDSTSSRTHADGSAGSAAADEAGPPAVAAATAAAAATGEADSTSAEPKPQPPGQASEPPENGTRDGAPMVQAVGGDGATKISGSGPTATGGVGDRPPDGSAVAARAAAVVGEVSKREGFAGNGVATVAKSGRGQVSSSLEEGGKTPGLKGQGCGCVVA